MLNISGLNEGIVLDHIQAGKSLDIYYNLGLDKLDCQVAIIKNARSNKMGRKDIIKIEGGLDHIDLDILGYIDHNITVNIIRDNPRRQDRREAHPASPEDLKERDPLQEPALHHLHRAGAAAYLLSCGFGDRDIPLHVLRGKVLQIKQKES